MIRHWPTRIRLTAAFTTVMAAVLLGVGIVTVTHQRESLDDSITESLQYRLRELQPEAGSAALSLSSPTRDAGDQVLDVRGQIIESSPDVADRPLLGPAELAAAQRGPIVVDHATAGGLLGPVRIAAAPAGDPGRIAVAAVTLADRDAAVADLRRELLSWLPLVLLATTVGAYLLAAAALRPVERMRAQAAAITADNPDRLPVPPARDEISRLGITFNELLDRLHAALQRERQFVADASHELRTPLSLLTTELELALRRPRTPEELTAALGSALEETGRLSRLALDLLLLARTDQTSHAETPARPSQITRLRPVLEAVLARHRTTLSEHKVTLHCPQHLAVRTHADDLDRAVSNLLDNAVQHGRPPIVITARHQPTNTEITALLHSAREIDDAGGAIVIDVRDHGTGFDPDFLPRAFDRFTRADDARTGDGTGLGLAIATALARRNGGQATATNHPGSGATVSLTLPAAPAAPEPPCKDPPQ